MSFRSPRDSSGHGSHTASLKLQMYLLWVSVDEDEDIHKEYVEETNRQAIMIAAAKLIANDTVPEDYLGPEIVSHFVMHGTSVAEIVKHLIAVLKKKNDDVSNIFLEALKRAYHRHMMVVSESNDGSLAGKSFKECKDLAARLSGTFVGAARNKHRSVILKIVKDGIEYAFVDAPKQLSFLDGAVVHFVSKLPTPDILEIKVKEAWDSKRDVLIKSGSFAIEQLSEALSASANSNRLPDGLSQKALELCAEQLSGTYDSKFGGFGSAPKFPRPVDIQLMLYQSKKLEETGNLSKAKEGLQMVLFSLQCMAKGGVHDHIGGGFHRYSVDECWHVPHFEKMLYDQGQLANVCLDAFSITKDVYYSCVSRDILDYLRRGMIGPSGEIFSAEDADSAESEGTTRKKEGAFYIWTSREVEDTLQEHATLFKEHYYIKPSGNCDLSTMSDPDNEFKGQNVLIERNNTAAMASKLGMPVEKYDDILGACRRQLFNVRSTRPRPHLDDKVIVSWNGLVISSFARASKILEDEPEGTKFNFPVTGSDPKEYMEVAEKAASFIRKQLYNQETRRLQHSFRNGPSKAPGFLDDYAFLISGLLDIYEFGGAVFWLVWAIELQDIQDELFLDGKGGGYFNTPGEDPSVLLRVKEDHDGAEPSGNSVSVINLVRLSCMVAGNRSDHYRENAEHLLAVFETRLKDMAMAVPLMCCGADMLSVPSRKQVVLVGQKSSVEFEKMLAAAHASYDRNKTVIHVDPTEEEELEFWEENNGKIATMAKNNFVSDKVVALVCQNFMCSPPVTNPKSLEALLSKKDSFSS